MVEESVQRIVWKKGRKKRRSRFRKKLSRNAGYIAIRVLHAAICRLPRPVGRAFAWLLGTAAYFLMTRERQIALDSLTRVYGAERSPREIRALARGVFRHSVHVVVDWLILRRWSRERLEKAFPECAAAIRQLAREHGQPGTGIVGITAHFGNWELHSILNGHFAPGIVVPIAKRLYFQKYQDFLHHLRTSTGGIDIIYTDESPRRMIRAVKEGRILGFLPDQEVRTNSGVFVDFFGLPAYTVTAPVQLARRLGAPMGISLLVREGKGYRAIFIGPFDVPRTDDEEADLLEGTQTWTRLLEAEIRKIPEQWSWLHPRWRTLPGKPRRKVDRSERSGRP